MAESLWVGTVSKKNAFIHGGVLQGKLWDLRDYSLRLKWPRQHKPILILIELRCTANINM